MAQVPGCLTGNYFNAGGGGDSTNIAGSATWSALNAECKGRVTLFWPVPNLEFRGTPVTSKQHFGIGPERLWNGQMFETRTTFLAAVDDWAGRFRIDAGWLRCASHPLLARLELLSFAGAPISMKIEVKPG